MVQAIVPDKQGNTQNSNYRDDDTEIGTMKEVVSSENDTSQLESRKIGNKRDVQLKVANMRDSSKSTIAFKLEDVSENNENAEESSNFSTVGSEKHVLTHVGNSTVSLLSEDDSCTKRSDKDAMLANAGNSMISLLSEDGLSRKGSNKDTKLTNLGNSMISLQLDDVFDDDDDEVVDSSQGRYNGFDVFRNSYNFNDSSSSIKKGNKRDGQLKVANMRTSTIPTMSITLEDVSENDEVGKIAATDREWLKAEMSRRSTPAEASSQKNDTKFMQNKIAAADREWLKAEMSRRSTLQIPT